MSDHPRRILITGATGGIGRALALEYAGPGRCLFLAGRNPGGLKDIETLCRNRGAATVTTRIDIRDREGLKELLTSCTADAPLDLAIACAGVSASARQVAGNMAPETPADTCRVLEVNGLGTITFAGLAAEAMLPHGRGQIALISSIAAYYGLPSSPAYCASKAAVRVYGRSLRHLLAPQGIRVNVICPGYVDTPMSRRLRGAQPLRWTAERAAQRITRALAMDKPEYAFPRTLSMGLQVLNLLPDRLARLCLAGFAFEVDPDRESPLFQDRE